MKKCLLIVALIIDSIFSIAQYTVRSIPVTDTVKAKLGKTKIVNGSPTLSSNDIIENIAQLKDCTLLITAIKNAGLTETFKSKGPITFFAPTNQAFEKLQAGELDTLSKPNHKFELSYLLTSHAIAGKLKARDIARKINSNKGQATFITISGSKLTAKLDSNHNIVLTDENGGESIISQLDIGQSNGMLHLVDSLLIPKAKTI